MLTPRLLQHTLSVLQVFQAKLLRNMDESGEDPGAFTDLRTATDLALSGTKVTTQAVGKAMASLCAGVPPMAKLDGHQGRQKDGLP